jgi:hypothetical protein
MTTRSNFIFVCLFALLVTGTFLFHFGGFVDRAVPALVDDHDIILPLGPSPTAKLVDIWNDLKATDDYQAIKKTGKATRFRPAHYPLKSLQTYLFGDNIRLWYVANFAMYTITATVLFWLVLEAFGIASAVVFGVFYFAHPAWSDILPRLGPVEIDCILFGTILIWLLWRGIRDHRWICLVSAIPAALLFGALKEPNSVFLVALGGLLFVCGMIVAHRRMMFGGAILVISGVIALAALFHFTASATSGFVPFSGPLHSYLRHCVRDRTFWLTFVLLGLLAWAAKARTTGLVKIGHAELAALVLAVVSIEALRFTIFYVTYYVSYDGGLDPIQMRYGSPMFVMMPIVAAIVFGRVAALASERATRPIKALALGCAILMLALNHGFLARLDFESRDKWDAFNSGAEAAIRKTADLLTTAREQGRNLTVVVSGPEIEWEPQLSLILFLRHRMPDTPVYFDVDEPSISAKYYTEISEEFGGHPITDAEIKNMRPDQCIELHVDIVPYQNPRCTSLSIVKTN